MPLVLVMGGKEIGILDQVPSIGALIEVPSGECFRVVLQRWKMASATEIGRCTEIVVEPLQVAPPKEEVRG